MLARRVFEHAEVYGNFMAPRKAIARDLDAGHDILLDSTGRAAQVKSISRNPRRFSFCRRSSMRWYRLYGRGQDSAEVIERRLAAAAHDVLMPARSTF